MVIFCIENVAMLFSCPSTYVPKTMKKNPNVSANQARKVICMFSIFRRCLFAKRDSLNVFWITWLLSSLLNKTVVKQK